MQFISTRALSSGSRLLGVLEDNAVSWGLDLHNTVGLGLEGQSAAVSNAFINSHLVFETSLLRKKGKREKGQSQYIGELSQKDNYLRLVGLTVMLRYLS